MNVKKINSAIWPALVTLGNLFCGFLAISYIADEKLLAAAWLIFLGMVFDMFDGKVARLTNASSEFGVQLDSLADMISFGVAPAFLVKTFILTNEFLWSQKIVWGVCLLFVISAAVRLAKFNVETDEEDSHTYFHGLATPAAAGVLASLVLVAEVATTLIPSNIYKISIIFTVVSLAMLMVSQIRYVHVGSILLKKRSFIFQMLAVTILVGIFFNYELLTILLSVSFLFYSLSGILNEVKIRNSFQNEDLVSAH